MSSTAIAIFAKTPGYSPVKTRLAKTIGRAAAETIYRLCVGALEQSVRAVDVAAYWVIPEAAAMDHSLWQGLPVICSANYKDNNLGRQQAAIYQTLLAHYDQAIMIGADAPQLSPALLQRSIDALQKHQFVVGPARDGGYYLFAGRQFLNQGFWTNLPYSSPDTCKRLLAALPEKPYLLESLTDLDREEDLPQLRRELLALPSCSEQQHKILNWLENYFSQ